MKTRYRSSFSPTSIVFAFLLAFANSVAAQDATAIRPGFGGKADEITVNVGLLDVVDIDNKAQLFSVDLFVQVKWHDPRLAANSDELDEFRTFRQSEVWTPRLTVLNDRGLEALLPEVVIVDRLGNVELRQRLAGPLAVDLDLREFPFDTQRLPVEVISYQYAPEELVFSKESAMITSLADFAGGGWVFGAAEPEISIYSLDGSGPGSSQLTFAVTAKREASYYVITLALPMTLILFPDIVPARMGMASATVFSMIALGVSSRLTMPDIAYLTAADRFVLYCTFLLIASLAVTVASARKIGRGDTDAANRLTRTARRAFPFVYIGILGTLAF
jgi:hypothetical protein